MTEASAFWFSCGMWLPRGLILCSSQHLQRPPSLVQLSETQQSLWGSRFPVWSFNEHRCDGNCGMV